MNKKIVFYTVGRILQIEGILLLLPTVVSLIYREKTALHLFLSALIAAAAGAVLMFICRKGDRKIFAREGFASVALSWIMMSAIGALPFYLSGAIPSYTSAFFETVSGFTTTGASILTDVTALSRGLLFWRSFTHWVGGMGVLVFIMAIFPSESGRSVHIMRAEMPGPIVGKLVPKIRETAKILYLIYIAMTVIMTVLLIFGKMSLFDSLIHAFGTAGTGGFGIRPDSVAGYSPYCQWVITVFMLLCGINFNLYYLIIIGRFRSAIKSSELWCYLIIVAASVIAVVINITTTVGNLYGTLSDTIRHSAFQVASVITTTGFSTVDFNLWPEFSKTLLLILMFIGGCAGSTAGGLKVSRLILMIKTVRRDLKRLIHPRSVNTVKFEGKTVENETVESLGSYFMIYVVIFFAILIILSFEPLDFTSTFSAVTACFNNVGPGFGTVGPMGSYASLSMVSKWLLSVAMLLGRLEIFPILLTLSPSTWAKK